jgi:hypothetical protein
MSIYLTLAVFCAIPMLIKLLRLPPRLTATPDGALEFRGRAIETRLGAFTGIVNGTSTRSQTTVSGHISPSYEGSGGGGTITSHTTVTNSFRLVNSQTRQEQNFQLTNMHVQVYDGQTVSVVSVIAKGKGAGDCLFVMNHTTGGRWFNEKPLRKLFRVGNPVLFVLYAFVGMAWNVVAWVLFWIWAVRYLRRVERFKTSGVLPFVGTLNQAAASLASFRTG